MLQTNKQTEIGLWSQTRPGLEADVCHILAVLGQVSLERKYMETMRPVADPEQMPRPLDLLCALGISQEPPWTDLCCS